MMMMDYNEADDDGDDDEDIDDDGYDGAHYYADDSDYDADDYDLDDHDYYEHVDYNVTVVDDDDDDDDDDEDDSDADMMTTEVRTAKSPSQWAQRATRQPKRAEGVQGNGEHTSRSLCVLLCAIFCRYIPRCPESPPDKLFTSHLQH